MDELRAGCSKLRQDAFATRALVDCEPAQLGSQVACISGQFKNIAASQHVPLDQLCSSHKLRPAVDDFLFGTCKLLVQIAALFKTDPAAVLSGHTDTDTSRDTHTTPQSGAHEEALQGSWRSWADVANMCVATVDEFLRLIPDDVEESWILSNPACMVAPAISTWVTALLPKTTRNSKATDPGSIQVLSIAMQRTSQVVTAAYWPDIAGNSDIAITLSKAYLHVRGAKALPDDQVALCAQNIIVCAAGRVHDFDEARMYGSCAWHLLNSPDVMVRRCTAGHCIASLQHSTPTWRDDTEPGMY